MVSRFLAMVDRLDQVLTAEPERGRAALQEVLGERITLQPDASGRFLWAEYSLGIAPLLQGAGASADLMVAGARFGTFLPRIRLVNPASKPTPYEAHQAQNAQQQTALGHCFYRVRPVSLGCG